MAERWEAKFAQAGNRFGGWPIWVIVREGTWDDIALVYNEKHARRMAAAEEMLAALEAVRDVEDLYSSGRAYEMLEAAIAKAKGLTE